MALSGAELAALIAGCTAAGGALPTWLATRSAARQARRTTTGQIATSEAGQLWDAAHNLIASLQAENTKLISQRDHLIDTFGRMLPMVESLVAAQEHDDRVTSRMLDLLEHRTALFAQITAMISARDAAIDRILTLVEGARDAVADTQAGPPDDLGT